MKNIARGSLLLFASLSTECNSFTTSSPFQGRSHPWSSSALSDSKKLNRDIEEASRRKAQGGGGGEALAGAVLGGLVLGPFGALFGAQMGANMGSVRAVDRARKEEMEKMGITPDMLEAAEEIGAALERSMEGLTASRDSLETQQRFARRLDMDSNNLYEKAKAAMAASNEDEARKWLMEREMIQGKLKKALLNCAEEKKRLGMMERNVEALEQRALEVDSLLRRSVGAKTLQDTTTGQLSLSDEDPLLQKFKDIGIN
mmetsp:Transcript_7243/g.10236  ORF Transcript_7243/g.10236 Transcript_7243/m.10236 type:complete len:258 (-) Transcript_7243:2656-3429(-)